MSGDSQEQAGAQARAFTVTREPCYEGFNRLRGSEQDTPDDFLIVVDGQRIGGTYWCQYNPAALAGMGRDDGGLPGESWASWGPRGLSCGHPDREAAEQVQVREYAADPGRYDRLLAEERAAREPETSEQANGEETMTDNGDGSFEDAGPVWGPDEIIDVYTAADAMRDGLLVSVLPEAAAGAGFPAAVTLTLAAWEECVAWDGEEDQRRTGAVQDEDGRLQDVLQAAARAVRSAVPGEGSASFRVLRVRRDGTGPDPEEASLELRAVEYAGKPMAIIMRPGED